MYAGRGGGRRSRRPGRGGRRHGAARCGILCTDICLQASSEDDYDESSHLAELLNQRRVPSEDEEESPTWTEHAEVEQAMDDAEDRHVSAGDAGEGICVFLRTSAFVMLLTQTHKFGR